MRPALLLVDLQKDFLFTRPGLEPPAAWIIDRATALLEGCRQLSIPVFHIWTTVDLEIDNRMPHWRDNNCFLCVKGTHGHTPPSSLTPLITNEFVVEKTFYSGFENPELESRLKQLGVDTLLIAGIYLHGCVRSTALDAYQRGYKIWLGEDATGSDDPLQGAITREYLQGRVVNFAPVSSILARLNGVDSIIEDGIQVLPCGIAGDFLDTPAGVGFWLHHSPRDWSKKLWQVPLGNQEIIEKVTDLATIAQPDWQTISMSRRRQLLENLAELIGQNKLSLILQLAHEIGKPIAQGEAEVNRSISLLETVARYAEGALIVETDAHRQYRYQPLGTIALITPWNNPLAIPVGKIAPALLYGNTVVWKPALAGSSIAVKLMELIHTAGFPDGVVNLVLGDRHTAVQLMSDSHIDAVSLSGSSGAGYTASAICAGRRIPLQAELGGNNAAIVWSDCAPEETARQLVQGAFSFAGQRCTANRRVIVEAECYEKFIEHLISAMEGLQWGDPLSPKTQVGPVISRDKVESIISLISRNEKYIEKLYSLELNSGQTGGYGDLQSKGAYYPPTIFFAPHPDNEIVQQETFGPILVVQKAEDWDEAIKLANGVKQGLILSLFSRSPQLQEIFLKEAMAGVLKINATTADVSADLPFGGWKISGMGVPEHGVSNREFYTRIQTIYSRTITP